MAIQSQPSRIPEPFAGSGTKNVIPATNATPSASQAASWASGFPAECSQPISAGGCPVPRNDFNGVLNQLSQGFAFGQDGGVWEWSASADYDLQRIVRGSDGLIYYSVAQSGPGTAAGAVNPVNDAARAFWASPSVPTMPASDRSSAAASTEWVGSWQDSTVLPSQLYVDSVNGSDSNDGTSAAKAFKTIGAAEARIGSVKFLAPVSVMLHIAAGTYPEVARGVRGVEVSYYGPSSGSSAKVSSFDITEGRNVVIGGKISTGYVNVSRCAVFRLGSGAALAFDASLVSSPTHAIYVFVGGVFTLFSGTSAAISFSGTWNVSTATLRAEYNATVALFGTVTWSGTVTGTQYRVMGSSSVNGIGGPNVIPGTAGSYSVDSTSYFS